MWIKEIVYNEEKFNLFSKPTIIMSDNEEELN